jgi:hypothetical protein
MAEERIPEETPGPGEAILPPPALTVREFLDSPEFRKFRTGIKKLLKVSKAELDERVENAKRTSPRAGNPNAPGRRKRADQ